LRIGNYYYKIIKQPLASKDNTEKTVRWLRLTVREDHGDQVLREIPKFNSRQMDSGCLQRMQKLSVTF
jgi:hypothetical protein